LRAFNQVGISGFSDPGCGVVAEMMPTPDKPTVISISP